MADLRAREEAIRTASEQVRHGSIWLRRAVDKETWRTVPVPVVRDASLARGARASPSSLS